MFQGWVWHLLGGLREDEDAGEESKEAAGGGDDEPDPWVVVLTVYNTVQATLAVARLRDEGIPARARQEAISSALPVTVGMLGRIDLMVPEAVAERALHILQDVIDLDGDDDLPEEDES
jgi:hypothetical protein